MKCPFCGDIDTKVIDSRPTEDDSKIRRRRECTKCVGRYTTYEAIETVPIMIAKKDGSREQFDKGKLMNGLLRACEKRHVSTETIEKAVDEIELKLQNSMEREIHSEIVGELAMEKLKQIDEVAYVRFASVYREFKDINTFMSELETLLKSKK